jgi:hypothetical protein
MLVANREMMKRKAMEPTAMNAETRVIRLRRFLRCRRAALACDGVSLPCLRFALVATCPPNRVC